ncbi:MAG: hypothetical protein JST28_02510 [Acidobacteria bacterium]|nr:hypothetical protein [Acidobacteriota bacterium]
MLALAFAFMLTACQSKMDKAIDQARQQAASTGQPQQIVAVDKTGTTTTTVVQPPAKGQAAGAIATTSTPPPPGGPVPAAQDPKVISLGGDPDQAGDSGTASPSGPVKVTIQAGTNLAVRVDQHISVKSNRAGDTFTGEVVSPVMDPNGVAVVPKGTRVSGVIDASHSRGRIKGASTLELRLTTMTLSGTEYQLRTADLTRSKKGKGKRSAAMIGGGAGLGMLIGGLAGGGKGMLIGGLAGGGAGTAGAAMTGNKDLEIPAESVVHFKLSQDLVVQGA